MRVKYVFKNKGDDVLVLHNVKTAKVKDGDQEVHGQSEMA